MIRRAREGYQVPLTPEEPRLLARRATWCGLVFSLGVLLTALNLLPPGAVHYRVRSELVVSARRAAQLKSLVERRRLDESHVQLIDVTVLDTVSSDAPANAEASGSDSDVSLVAVDSLWIKRCTRDEHQAWIEAITRTDEQQLTNTEAARKYRFAKWQLETARHYAAHHRFLNPESPSEDSSHKNNFDLVSSREAADGQRPSVTAFTLGYPKTGSASEDKSSAAETAHQQELHEELASQVKQAEANYLAAQIAWQQALEESSGLVRSVAQPKVSVLTHTAPWLVGCLVILGITSGSIGGWFQHRLHSSAAYTPHLVAARLALQGLPVAGKVHVKPLDADQDWFDSTGRNASDATRRLARNLLRVSEWTVGFWFLCLAVRFTFDPLWRSAFLLSPLGALARLLIGMP